MVKYYQIPYIFNSAFGNHNQNTYPKVAAKSGMCESKTLFKQSNLLNWKAVWQ